MTKTAMKNRWRAAAGYGEVYEREDENGVLTFSIRKLWETVYIVARHLEKPEYEVLNTDEVKKLLQDIVTGATIQIQELEDKVAKAKEALANSS